ncbi:hypothetical protein FRC16_006513 [Serendipita sp. 398]|nr:hypothetical protein FRC16_006513 [Serendipita sp. 398]
MLVASYLSRSSSCMLALWSVSIALLQTNSARDNKLGPLICLIVILSCESILIIGGYGALLSFAMSNWILLARTRALLGRKRSYDAILILYFLLSYGITSVLVVASTTPLISTTFYSQLAHICGIVERPKVMGFIWVCPMVFETTIFIITTTRLYQRAGQAAALFGSKLLLVLYRDGVCYYLIIIGLRTWLLLSWTIFPISYMFTGYFLLWAAMSISVTRLQLNLIKVAKRHPLTEDSQLYPMRTISRHLHRGEQQEESTRQAVSLTRVEFGSSV